MPKSPHSVRLDPSIREHANKDGVSITDFIEEACRQKLTRYDLKKRIARIERKLDKILELLED